MGAWSASRSGVLLNFGTLLTHDNGSEEEMEAWGLCGVMGEERR